MTMTDWATNEVELAIAKEDSDYGKMCYESALKAYKTLMEDPHSGLSWSFTREILNRLMYEKPLTPLEDTPDQWNQVNDDPEFQHKRRSSLFKRIDKDGNISYSDVSRFVAYNINRAKVPFYSGLCNYILDDMYPIEFPYMPESTISFYVEEFLTDKKNGDFDTVGVIQAVKDDVPVRINRYFREPVVPENPTYHGWVEIDEAEYIKRRQEAIK